MKITDFILALMTIILIFFYVSPRNIFQNEKPVMVSPRQDFPKSNIPHCNVNILTHEFLQVVDQAHGSSDKFMTLEHSDVHGIDASPRSCIPVLDTRHYYSTFPLIALLMFYVLNKSRKEFSRVVLNNLGEA